MLFFFPKLGAIPVLVIGVVTSWVSNMAASSVDKAQQTERILWALMGHADFEALMGDLGQIYDRKRDRLGKEEADRW